MIIKSIVLSSAAGALMVSGLTVPSVFAANGSLMIAVLIALFIGRWQDISKKD